MDSQHAARLRPSEARHAFAAAKLKASSNQTIRILEFVNAADHTTRTSSTVPNHKPLFEPTPAGVWIDEYTAFDVHTTKLTFRNCDTVARRMKIESPSSPFFRVLPWAAKHPGTVSVDKIDGKVAAGMEIAFVLEFMPHEIKDYAVDLVCVTEREKFLLPVRVRGKYAALDLPDAIDFGVCPVKMPSSRVLKVHNVGSRSGRFAFRTTQGFRIQPESAVLEHGAGTQIELIFTPLALAMNEGELLITDDTGQTCAVQLTGDVRNVEVYLSQPLVEPAATYITLSSRRTIKICNDSEYTLDFCWKAFPDHEHEQIETERLLDELRSMEAAELEELEHEQSAAAASDDTEEQAIQSPFDTRKAVENKYKHLRKAAMEDTMQFVSECFAITPVSGRVWAHSEVDVVACFSPASALLYSSSAYLEIGGQEGRLPLQIRGQGIGPKAKVIYNEFLDFGDVFINDERTRDFTIQNRGEIPADFELIPIPESTAVRFEIHPAQGTLTVNEMCKIEVTIFSYQLGEVFQAVRFKLHGSEDQLCVRVKAVIVPPIFHFDVDQLDFGLVSYSFPQTKIIKLVNASKIAMNYSLRIPEEANYKKKEFELLPVTGRLEAYGEQQVQINFTSFNVKTYDYHLVVGVTGVGSDLLRIPVKAHCLVPEVTIHNTELEFGECFLRYPHKQTLVLENKSTHLDARYEIGEQDDHSKAIAIYGAPQFTGAIRPEQKIELEVFLSCEKLGSIRLPMSVSIAGSTEVPMSVTLTAVGTGPKVLLDQQEISWGNCSCLVDHERILRMTNTSLIPAPYKTFIRSARSKFQVDQKEGTLPPGESLDLVLIANLDDTIVFKDQLYVLVTEGENLVVPLSIKGVGTTMWSQSDLRVIDFGHQMTNKECEWSCTLENKGKRAQVLTWVNKAAPKPKLNDEPRAKKTGTSTMQKSSSSTSSNASTGSKAGSGNNNGATRSGGDNGGNETEEEMAVFSVFPGTIELKPRTACVFVFKGLAIKPGLVSEELVCETKVGKEKGIKIAFVTEIRGNFLNPALQPSASLLSFSYIHHPGAEIARQSQPLSLKNVCELPLSFTLRTQTPFSLDCWEATLQPGEMVEFNVEFYPGFKDDYMCRLLNGKVLVTYVGHPQKDSVDLLGDISFPNLEFENSKIDFGCTLNDTQKSLLINVRNVSKVETNFRWVFIEDEKEAKATATAKKPYIPINQVFDILPIRGRLQPGESEKVEFLYYGHPNRKFKSLVACEVEGGPEYELTLLGEASSLVYKLDKQCIDFGQVLYNKTEDREFAIINTGKVPFPFSIYTDKVSRGRSIEIVPMTGKIGPNDKQRIVVRLRPGIPENFEETLIIEVAHFQPMEFKLYGSGIFASVAMNLPRENHPASVIKGEYPKWKDLKKAARQTLESNALSALVAHSKTLGSSDSKSSIATVPRGLEKINSSASMALSPGKQMTSTKSSMSMSIMPGLRHSSAAAGGPGSIVDDLDVEIEACRMFFADYLLVLDAARNDTSGSNQATQENDDDEAARTSHDRLPEQKTPISSTLSLTKGAASVMTDGSKPSKKRGPDSFAFLLSHFVLDFGNVVVGTHKIRKFSITNIGHVPASFQLDKNLALSRGFQIEPERVVRLPEKQSVEFTVTFQARKSTALGNHHVQLPIVMKNGPPCLVTIRALVTVPDISISMDTLDFGKLQIGTSLCIFTQLTNTSVVAAEWAIKKPMGSARDLPHFRITPQGGTLPPGHKVNVQVEFVPEEGRHYSLKLPIKVSSNTKTRSITCRGDGAELRLSFSPAMVELGPLLPCLMTGDKTIEMRNDSDYPVEVFSLDFDDDYKEEEELLRTLGNYNADELFKLPLRPPGQTLHAYLMEHGVLAPPPVEEVPVEELPPPVHAPEPVAPHHDPPLSAREAADHHHPASPTATVAAHATVQSVAPAPTPVVEQTEIVEPEIPSAVLVDGRKCTDYLVLGPPRCGVSTQARLLSEKEGLPIWTIEDAVQQVIKQQTPLGIRVCQALGVVEPVVAPPIEPSPSALELKRPPSQSTEPVPEAVAAPAPVERDVLAALREVLEDVLLWRLAQPDLAQGSVLDGIRGPFTTFAEGVELCTRVLRRARVVLLTVEDELFDGLQAAISREETMRNLEMELPHVLTTRTEETLLEDEEENQPVAVPVPEFHQPPLTDPHHHAPADSHSHTAASTPRDGDAAAGAAAHAVPAHAPAASAHAPAVPELPVVVENPLIAIMKVQEEQYKQLLASIGIRNGPTYAEYQKSLDDLRAMLLAFIVKNGRRANGDSDAMTAASPGDPETGAHISNQAKHESPSSLATAARELSRSDNFLLEVPINDVGPALSVHNNVFAALEKQVRELEACHLAIPPPIKSQLIRRPTQRFARKPVQRFTIQLYEPPVVPSAAPQDSPRSEHDTEPPAPMTARSTVSIASTATTGAAPVAPAVTPTPTAPAPAPAPVPVVPSTPKLRWVIQPHESVKIIVKFTSSDVGVFDSTLGFEIVGVRREFNLFCRGLCSVPTINSDPRNVFMSRVKGRAEGAFVQKKYVMSKNQFEFGPLIVLPSVTAPQTEEDFAQLGSTKPGGGCAFGSVLNMETFRMSNNSKFPLRIDFGLQDAETTTFAVFPPFLDLPEGETGEVKVWASPPADGLHEAVLLCCMSDNPEPLCFPMTCYGCTPTLALRGPWEQPPSLLTTEAPPASMDPGSTPPPVLDFEQLLLKRQDEKTFFIENTSAVAIAWRINTDNLPADFRLFPTEGMVKPFQKSPVLTVFTATVEAVHKLVVPIDFSDADSALKVSERTRQTALAIHAEAYRIDVCSFENDTAAHDRTANATCNDGSLDFGLVRVGETHTKTFHIRNRGKYNIKYVMSLRSAGAREYFRIEPLEQVLEPDKVATVQVTFSAKHEVTLRDCRDIKCTIIEMISGEPCSEFHVFATVRAVFSLFRLQPNRGINFGPLKYNEPARTKRIEIKNEGEFVFKYRVLAASSHGIAGADAGSGLEELTLDTVLAPTTAKFDQFSITPDCGSIDPGVTAALDVQFQPKGCAVYRQLLRIEISGRNQADTSASDALLYELVGESCFPGINTIDFESIFEEQIVVRSLGQDANTGGRAPTSAPSGGFQGVVFAEREQLFSFGAMVAAANSKGAMERFKISNPTKVATTVHFQVLPSANSSNTGAGASAPAAGNGGGGANGLSDMAFSAQPAVWEIPPLEHRFVNVYFKPTAIMPYNATFVAKVDDSPESDTTGSVLQFELRGEGTMPCVSILEPTQRDAGGALVMNFGRVRLSKSKDMTLVLRNDGILSATVLFTMQANPNFVFAPGNGSVVVAPKATENLTVQFRPQKIHEPEPTTAVVKLSVQNNMFEETTIRLSGAGYREDLTFEDLPQGLDDELHFDDVVLSATPPAPDDSGAGSRNSVKVFSVCNQTGDMIRFAWPKLPPFTFMPSVGHLRPRSFKLITATFTPPEDKPAVFAAHKVAVTAQRIALKDTTSAPGEWDESVQTVSYGDLREAVAPATEPAHDLVGTASTVTLSCFAAADVPAVECDCSTIHFKHTFMLQVCSHRVSVKNKSKIQLQYRWRWERAVDIDHDGAFLTHQAYGGANGTQPNAEDECPFEMTPMSGTISADDAQVFVVKFAPVEVDDYQYTLILEAVATSPTALTGGNEPCTWRVDVQGSSLRPACHFDLERSDYPQRRAPHLAGPNGELGPLDPSVKVVEMESLGVRVRNTRRFYVINPTNVSYEFLWMPEGDVNANFRCATPKGLMLAGKRCEMIFEFTPQQLELQEMFWRFKIPHFDVNQLFLFVGTTTEPRVSLDRGSVNFNTLLIGTKAAQSVSLINQEHIPFNFVFDKASLEFAGEAPALLVHPLSGVVPPNSRSTIEIEFIPTEEKTYNFNLNCIVKRKPTRLSLNVKGEGYSIRDALTIMSEDQAELRTLALGITNVLDFGAVRVNEEVQRVVVIHNSGKFNFDFNWSTGIKLMPALSIEPIAGSVKKNDKVACRLLFAPTKQTSLEGFQVACTVAGSKVYQFSLHGTAVPPSLQFSFTAFDFGACFVAELDALPLRETATLTIFNMDPDAAIDLDCVFEKKAHLRVDCPPTVVGPRESVHIPIVFTPRLETTYTEILPFVINGSSTVSVTIRGEGIAPKVELLNISMQQVSFGSIQIGQVVSRVVRLINRTKRKTTIELYDTSMPGVPSLEMLGISIFPQRELTLKSKETVDVEFKFSSAQRVAAFQKEVFMRIAGSSKRLLTLSGSCLGMEVQMEADTITFGAVCLGSQLVRKMRLQNRGDMAAKFQWNTREFSPDFAISPAEGVVAPNHHKTLEITFKPSATNPDIRYDRLACAIEGAESLFLTLVGSCVNQAASSISEINFESRVREETSKEIVIENKTNAPWNLFPVVQGEHWYCQENVAVPAEGKTAFNIMYCPLTMTKQSEDDEARPDLHRGSIFFAIPDGSALLYNVVGKAFAPASSGTLTLSASAKKALPISIPIKNWLKAPQTFTVAIEKPADKESLQIQGPTSMTLYGGATRNYNLKFFSYTEGSATARVRFTNPDNGEYLFYDLAVTVAEAAEVETLHFEAPVRQSLKKVITIENPFGPERSISFVDSANWWKCSSPAIRVRELNAISGRPEGSYEVEYRPILHRKGSTDEQLTISFAELGDYKYRLVLTTQAAGTERILQFKAPLGGSQTQTFAFTTYCDKLSDLACSVQASTFFSVPPVCKVEGTTDWDGKAHSVAIKFEPEALGEARDTLTLSSDVAGEYKCALVGVAVPPLPQGPFVFTSSKDIEFKNVFSTAKEFEVVVDNPKFLVAAKTLAIPPKSAKTISVRIDWGGGSAPTGKGAAANAPPSGATGFTGKLYVSCPSIKDLPPWVYYLEASPAAT
ncbi:TPA: hypothetical protein N0F65_007364 [Lagenidium giganteum]|uniref:MSP domain-containing protein n=1 Tax=Lagenidium giganteum TaxID=4803 RepID=A0AAV2YIS6_9STRA|nr:TPA: hypothetical protein N0F65_007364 [Lagenidium giganteum]